MVEFADWNSEKIGIGADATAYDEYNGKTDAMKYHTGITVDRLNKYSGFTQYRNIEGWWNGVSDWIDGCYIGVDGLYIITNPQSFTDGDNGILLGWMKDKYGQVSTEYGYPSDFTVPTQSGLEWALYPAALDGSGSTYVPDAWYVGGSYECIHHGSVYGGDSTPSGMFHLDSHFYAYSGGNVTGCRLQERPPKAT